MLISEKIQQIQDILAQVQSLNDKNLSEFKDNSQRFLSQMLEELKAQNAQLANSHLQEAKDTLLSAIDKEIGTYSKLLENELKSFNAQELAQLSQSLQSQNTQDLAHLSDELQNALYTELKSTLSQSLPSEITHTAHLQESLKEYVKETLAGAEIDYTQLPIDTERLSQEVSQNLQESVFALLKQDNAQALEELIQGPFMQECIKETLTAQAPKVWANAIEKDALIHQRWEAKLRLESLKILALQEGIAELIREETNKNLRKSLSEPTQEKQNILVSK
ncbi:hypothetical protein LS68_009185 [Helicobacter sp. MIT 05-5293]|uniref:hypothetical protein n=1 Tax=unclassified Helicobacter TaxID=2593540 RepID=UPI00051CF23D|nr:MULTISPECIES: hypothetical protein [unclassified Helicobacter]TLD79835.1 hypothetical protein LS68_009185 [Helicobacter sp. MIT 05-5293]TLD85454.1 hypothetical protein LS69_009490 [Helicobacter sp. MIT 05-5294]